jgi:hypothetical protein
MKKIFLLFSTFLIFTLGCGDAGFESDISKLIEIDPLNVSIDVPALALGIRVPSTPAIVVETDPISFGDGAFDDYDLGEIERYTINEIYYSIEGFDAGSGSALNEADLDVNMNISFDGGSAQSLVNTTIANVQNNVQDVKLYDKSNPGSVNASTIQGLEQALLNGGSFALELDMIGRDVLLQTVSQNFNIVFKFDVTVRVQLIDSDD